MCLACFATSNCMENVSLYLKHFPQAEMKFPGDIDLVLQEYCGSKV